jgi:hypothetical protein
LFDYNQNPIQPDKIKNLYALKVDCDYPDEIDVVTLDKQEDGFHIKDELTNFIVFSDNDSSRRVQPRFHTISSNTTTREERLNNIRTNLSNNYFNDYIWDKITVYFQFIVENNLPFKTIDYFRIIAESPLFMVKMALVILNNKVDGDIRLKGFAAFEQEFALAWHWIDNKTWQEGKKWIMKFDMEIIDYYRRSILGNSFSVDDSNLFVSNILALSSNSDVQNCTTDISSLVQIYLNSYIALIGINDIENKLIKDGNKIIHPNIRHKWRDLIDEHICDNINFRPFLLAPVKAALSTMGEDGDWLWQQNHEQERRIIFYYWQMNPGKYAELYMAMIQEINHRINNN